MDNPILPLLDQALALVNGNLDLADAVADAAERGDIRHEVEAADIGAPAGVATLGVAQVLASAAGVKLGYNGTCFVIT